MPTSCSREREMMVAIHRVMEARLVLKGTFILAYYWHELNVF